MKEIYRLNLNRVCAEKKRKRTAAAICAPVLCAIVLLTAILSTSTALTGPGDSWDLYNFIDQVVITDGEGNVIPDGGTISAGESYSIALHFDGGKFNDAINVLKYKPNEPYKDRLVYQLPDGITVPDEVVQGGPYIISGGPVSADLGEFEITGDGLIIVHFYDVNDVGAPIPFNLLDLYPDIKFWITLEATFPESGEHTFDFGDDIDITLSVMPLLDVTKIAYGYDTETETIRYAVTVTAENGDVKDITIEDAARAYTDANTWWIEGSDYACFTVTCTDSEWPDPITPDHYEMVVNEHGFIIDFTGYTLHEGETITLEYIIHLSSLLDIFQSGEDDDETNRWDIGSGLNVTNTVLVNGTDQFDVSLKPIEREGNVLWPVDKSMAASNTYGNLAHFSIVVNPDGLRLNPSTPYDERITLTDRMSNTLALYLNTVKVEELKPGMKVGDPDCWQELSRDDWSFTVVNTLETEMTFDLPDQKPLLISYDVRVKGNVDETVPIGNYCQITGGFSTETSGSFTIAPGASMSRGSVTLFKKDDFSNTPLPGAEFALYRREQYTGWDNVANRAPEGVPQTITVGGEDFYYFLNIYDYTKPHSITDEYGQIIFESNWLTLTYDYLVFALYEVEAPDGYSLPESERVTLFSFGDQTTEVGGVPVNRIETDYISVGNMPTQVDLSGRKAVAGAFAGIDIPDETFRFKLTQVADAYGAPMDDPITREAAVDADGEGEYAFTFDPIYGLTQGTYYFKIEEQSIGSKYWTIDGAASSIVRVDVSANGSVTVAGVSGAPANIAFTNTFHPPVGSLIIHKVVEDQSDMGVFTYTVWDSENNPVDLTSAGVSVEKIGGSGTYDPTDLENGTFTMTRDTEVQISGLTPGDYTVTEDAMGYTITYSVDGEGDSATKWNNVTVGGVAVIEDGETVVVFTNIKYTVILPETGGIGDGKFYIVVAVLTSLIGMFCTGAMIFRRRRYRGWMFKRE